MIELIPLMFTGPHKDCRLTRIDGTCSESALVHSLPNLPQTVCDFSLDPSYMKLVSPPVSRRSGRSQDCNCNYRMSQAKDRTLRLISQQQSDEDTCTLCKCKQDTTRGSSATREHDNDAGTCQLKLKFTCECTDVEYYGKADIVTTKRAPAETSDFAREKLIGPSDATIRVLTDDTYCADSSLCLQLDFDRDSCPTTSVSAEQLLSEVNDSGLAQSLTLPMNKNAQPQVGSSSSVRSLLVGDLVRVCVDKRRPSAHQGKLARVAALLAGGAVTVCVLRVDVCGRERVTASLTLKNETKLERIAQPVDVEVPAVKLRSFDDDKVSEAANTKRDRPCSSVTLLSAKKLRYQDADVKGNCEKSGSSVKLVKFPTKLVSLEEGVFVALNKAEEVAQFITEIYDKDASHHEGWQRKIACMNNDVPMVNTIKYHLGGK